MEPEPSRAIARSADLIQTQEEGATATGVGTEGVVRSANAHPLLDGPALGGGGLGGGRKITVHFLGIAAHLSALVKVQAVLAGAGKSAVVATQEVAGT